MPGNGKALGESNQTEQRQAKECQKEDTCKGQIRAHVARNNLNVETQALVGSNEFRNGCAYRCIDRGML